MCNSEEYQDQLTDYPHLNLRPNSFVPHGHSSDQLIYEDSFEKNSVRGDKMSLRGYGVDDPLFSCTASTGFSIIWSARTRSSASAHIWPAATQIICRQLEMHACSFNSSSLYSKNGCCVLAQFNFGRLALAMRLVARERRIDLCLARVSIGAGKLIYYIIISW
jgi:hypothetical protein